MLREKLKTYSFREKIAAVLFSILIIFSLRLFVKLSSDIHLFFEVQGDIKEETLTMIDKANGIKENLVEIANWCRSKIPYNSDVFFFASPEFFNQYRFNKKHLSLFFPYRLRYYLYPDMKVWCFKLKYQFLVDHWSHVNPSSQESALEGINYIIGFSINENMFPLFKQYASKEDFYILKRMR